MYTEQRVDQTTFDTHLDAVIWTLRAWLTVDITFAPCFFPRLIDISARSPPTGMAQWGFIWHEGRARFLAVTFYDLAGVGGLPSSLRFGASLSEAVEAGQGRAGQGREGQDATALAPRFAFSAYSQPCHLSVNFHTRNLYVML